MKCLYCGVNDVKRVEGRRPNRKYREQDGVRWSDFCSRECQLAVVIEKRSVRERAAFMKRMSATLTEEAKACVDGGKVSMHALIRLVWACEKRGYARGYAAAWDRSRRHKRAA